MDANACDFVLHYHKRTKHFPERFARSPGYLDWETQPNPFRRFVQAPIVPLLLDQESPSPPYDSLFKPASVSSKRLCLETVSAFFELSMAISAWKALHEARWALRINPSSGNLHPTEGYLILGAIKGLHDRPAVFHYAPQEHVLERRTEFEAEVWNQLVVGFPPDTFLVGLSSIHWREAWKYGERAFRYCQHDVGHALGALSFSAAIQGWSVRMLDGVSDAQVASLLGLDRTADYENAEREHPDLLVAVVPASPLSESMPTDIPNEAVTEIAGGDWVGKANQLSGDHENWEIIDAVADACTKAVGGLDHKGSASHFPSGPIEGDCRTASAGAIIRGRRSAVAMDGTTSLSAEAFYLMLDRVLPRVDRTPFCSLASPALVHLGLFVHLIDGIPPGVYVLVRTADGVAKMKAAMRSEFCWERPPDCPDTLPLFLLGEGDVRSIAWRVSCDQQIAGASAFSCGMIAEFEPRLRRFGAWLYRRLYWETGLIGQVLYLEAEAAGRRATGIGCFYDDPVHDVFGLTGTDYQSLYHFTIGGAVEDTRLTTLSPYPKEVVNR